MAFHSGLFPHAACSCIPIHRSLSTHITQHMAACSWNILPTELRLHTVGFLQPESVKAFSEVSCEAYALCVPTLFRVSPHWHLPLLHYSPIYPTQNVTLNSYEALSSFMRHVPKPYYHHIRSLSLCLKPSLAGSGPIDQTNALINVLSFVTRVESLSLHFIGSPAKAIIPSFQNLCDLRSLHVSNCGDENTQPLCVHFPFSATSVSEC